MKCLTLIIIMHIVLKRYMPILLLKGVRALKIHIVQKGDTIWEIAQQYGVNFEELKKLNSHLSSPDMIMPGMKIKIPVTSKQVKTSPPVKTQTQKGVKKEGEKVIVKGPKPVKKGETYKKTEKVQQEELTKDYTFQPLKQPHLGGESLTVENKYMQPAQPKQQPKTKHQQQPKPVKFGHPQQTAVEGLNDKGQQMPKYEKQPETGHMSAPYYANQMPMYPLYPCCCCCYHCMGSHQNQMVNYQHHKGNMYPTHNPNMNEKHIFSHYKR